ncbi:MAG TPA: hypothetical protein VKA67_11225 [Verrucomicrobiae bacterium]|nr:hypothetical protein [Verrucomicrobiae bacterium]
MLVRLLTLICLASSSLAASAGIQVYAGGVAGVASLADPKASLKFREAGGGLYLHNSGWGKLDLAQQQQVLTNFAKLPVAIELGFGRSEARAAAWSRRLQSGYLALGIKPAFIAANAFANNHHPTVEQWRDYTHALRSAGLPASTLVLPTFEYANFRANLATLADNTVSKRRDFQELIRTAGGIVLDSPPGYSLRREANYRTWIIDAIHWTHQQGCTVVWIASPNSSRDHFRSDTGKFLRLLKQKNALPDVIVCENYNPHPPRNYPNVVGDENQPNTTLGVAWYLLNRFLPEIEVKREHSSVGQPDAHKPASATNH